MGKVVSHRTGGASAQASPCGITCCVSETPSLGLFSLGNRGLEGGVVRLALSQFLPLVIS